MTAGLTCATCGTAVDEGACWPWTCPRAVPSEHHVLVPVPRAAPTDDDPNAFVRYGRRLASLGVARAHGMAPAAQRALVRSIDAAVAGVAGHGFVTTPLGRADALSDALAFSGRGGVWVKDETAGVAGSHKARHLVGILLHLLAAEALGLAPRTGRRPPLATASCGNAAVAAAVLAAAVDWPLLVFVPPDADPAVLAELATFGAAVNTCPRSPRDPPGDPCVSRMRAAVAAGAVPFTVQGPENGLALDGGRTMGWEAADQLAAAGVTLDRVYVQVGGGALASCLAAGLREGAVTPRLYPVQTAGCAPLAAAWPRAHAGGTADAGLRWREWMVPWPHEARSAAGGILDDETYDGLTVIGHVAASGGAPVVVAEARVDEAHALARRTTGVDVSATGTAGLAGLLAERERVGDDERVMVVFSGHR